MNNTEKNSDRSGSRKNNESNKNPGGWWIYVVLLALLFIPAVLNSISEAKEITWQQFEANMLSRKAVEKIVVVNNEKAEIFIKKSFAENSMFKEVFKPIAGKANQTGPHYYFNIGSVESFERKLGDAEKNFPAYEIPPVTYEKESRWWWSILDWVIPLVLLFLLWNYLLRRSMGAGGTGVGGSSVFNFGRSNATLIEKEKSKITFKDVAGLEEAEMEIKEIVDFLKSPETFTRLGAKIPKGVISGWSAWNRENPAGKGRCR